MVFISKALKTSNGAYKLMLTLPRESYSMQECGGFAVTNPPDEVPKWAQTMQNVPLFVGMIANSWAKLEHAMVPMANKLLRTADPTVGKVVMFSLTPPGKRDLLLALTKISPLTENMKSGIRDFCKEFDRLRILRNNIVHGRWDQLSTTYEPILHTSSSRASLKEKFDEKDTAWLIQTRNEIEQLVFVAFDLNDMLVGLWPSTGTPKKPRQPR